MIETELLLRWLHVIGASVLLGTGAGIAFFMLMAWRTRDVVVIAHTAGIVVLADFLFTMLAVIAQPLTGWLLAREVGWSLGEPWIMLSLVLYGVTGALWLPVVFQIPPEFFCLEISFTYHRRLRLSVACNRLDQFAEAG